jgi:hypothetical protein
MSYKSPLETRLAKKVTRAITEHKLIEDGDRIMDLVFARRRYRRLRLRRLPS